MARILSSILNKRALLAAGALLLAILFFTCAIAWDISPVWPSVLCALLLAPWVVAWIKRRLRARRASQRLSDILGEEASEPVSSTPTQQAELDTLKTRMLDALKTIKTSSIGQYSGKTALYAMPWYLLIGSPSAGKSSAILNAGLQFPFADKDSGKIRESGGTRNCDWIFTTEGILLDTAGRYAVRDEDRGEWHGFLKLLRRYRPKAPVNGVVVMASIAELRAGGPDGAAQLARTLRQRVQDIIEKLEVIAPVYVVFTKADLIAGFDEFFNGIAEHRNHVWGATLALDGQGEQDIGTLFDARFEELHAGLRALGVSKMSAVANGGASVGQFDFPHEFAACRDALHAFLSTLFENNLFQYKPVLRGFYFTSALQEGAVSDDGARRVAARFGLDARKLPATSAMATSSSFFLRDLFSKILFKDGHAVRPFDSPARKRLRRVVFFGGAALLALTLTGLTWSAMNNQQLIRQAQADLDRAVNLQQKRDDLQSAFQAMNILEDRLTQLEQLRRSRPLSVSLGLYQGEPIERKLRDEYFGGLRRIMLEPATDNLASFLKAVNANPGQLAASDKDNAASPRPADAGANSQGGMLYQDASTSSVTDAYNALKTYLMLGDRSHVDASQLSGQLPRFWRSWLESHRGAMSREDMVRNAERMIGFYLAHAQDSDAPVMSTDIALIDQTRNNLRHVVRDMPVRQRAYEEIKARASTRFAPVTVARIVGQDNASLIGGSYAIPGAFTREAWFQYVQSAILDVATRELQARDWVLNTSSSDDLSLQGTPEEVQKALIAMYMADYAQHWRSFLQGIVIQRFPTFDAAVTGMNRLGDPQTSPLRKVLVTAFEQTSWDAPSRVDSGIRRTQNRVSGWFSKWFSHGVDTNGATGGMGGTSAGAPIAQEFAGLALITREREGAPTLLRAYLDALSKVRTRFNILRNEGNPGPGARQLMQQTMDGSGSELADALRLIDEQMLTGLNDKQRATLRPVLVRPLMQAYGAVIQPASAEVNRVWNAQVYQPFQTTLVSRYPFASDAKVEASAADIGQVFGPDGAISKFAATTLGPLAVRRGNTLTPRTWADMGIALAPAFTEGFARWVAPLSGGAASGASAEPQTVFQVMPQAAGNVTEYTLTIDGQQLRYRNTPPQWANFVWPNPGGAPGVTLSAVTFDGHTVPLVDEPGRYGLEKLINSAQRKRLPDGGFELSWTREGITVTVGLRLVSTSQPAGGDTPQQQGLRGVRLPASIADSISTTDTPASAPVAASGGAS